MINSEDVYQIGKFQRTHALKGELNMISQIQPDYFIEGNPLIIEYDGILVPFYVENVRPKGSTSYLVKLSGVDSEEQGSSFVNKEIFILKHDAEKLIQQQIIESHPFINYKIIDSKTGEEIGLIKDVEDSTVNTLFIVETPGGEEIMIPASQDFIVEIKENDKIIRMVLPEGLLKINLSND